MLTVSHDPLDQVPLHLPYKATNVVACFSVLWALVPSPMPPWCHDNGSGVCIGKEGGGSVLPAVRLDGAAALTTPMTLF